MDVYNCDTYQNISCLPTLRYKDMITFDFFHDVIYMCIHVHLRNGFTFWKGFTLTLQEARSVHNSMNIQNLNLLLIFTFYYEHLKYSFLNSGIKKVLYLK